MADKLASEREGARHHRTTLLAAVAAFGLGAAPVLVADQASNSGYSGADRCAATKAVELLRLIHGACTGRRPWTTHGLLLTGKPTDAC